MCLLLIYIPKSILKRTLTKRGPLGKEGASVSPGAPFGVRGDTSAPLMPTNPPCVRCLGVTSRQASDPIAMLASLAAPSKVLGTTRL